MRGRYYNKVSPWGSPESLRCKLRKVRRDPSESLRCGHCMVHVINSGVCFVICEISGGITSAVVQGRGKNLRGASGTGGRAHSGAVKGTWSG